jgi:malate dehydrogenase (quinone)
VEIDKAVATNNKFMTSLAFWSFLVEKSILPDATFIQPAPHILFVHGEEKREWLKRRVEKLSKLPAFAATEYSEDYDKSGRGCCVTAGLGPAARLSPPRATLMARR